MSLNALQALKERERFEKGQSEAAAKRRGMFRRLLGKVFHGRPGETLNLERATYFVAADGSFRREGRNEQALADHAENQRMMEARLTRLGHNDDTRRPVDPAWTAKATHGKEKRGEHYAPHFPLARC